MTYKKVSLLQIIQTTYSQNSIPIDEERRKLFKNVIKKNSKIYPVKLVRYFESKYKPESEKTNPEYQHKSIENEVNNKSNTLTRNTSETAPKKPAKPVLNQTERVQKTSRKRFNTHNLVNKVYRYQKAPHKVGLFWYS